MGFQAHFVVEQGSPRPAHKTISGLVFHPHGCTVELYDPSFGPFCQRQWETFSTDSQKTFSSWVANMSWNCAYSAPRLAKTWRGSIMAASAVVAELVLGSKAPRSLEGLLKHPLVKDTYLLLQFLVFKEALELWKLLSFLGLLCHLSTLQQRLLGFFQA